MDNFGARLKELRRASGLNQADFAALGKVARLSQLKYESGERSPDADYLAALHDAGHDVFYLLTGCDRGGDSLAVDETEMLHAFRKLSPTQRHSMVTFFQVMIDVPDDPKLHYSSPILQTSPDR